MTTSQTTHSRRAGLVGRVASGARALSSRIDRFAYRSQLGPSRPREMYDFRPSRRI